MDFQKQLSREIKAVLTKVSLVLDKEEFELLSDATEELRNQCEGDVSSLAEAYLSIDRIFNDCLEIEDSEISVMFFDDEFHVPNGKLCEDISEIHWRGLVGNSGPWTIVYDLMRAGF